MWLFYVCALYLCGNISYRYVERFRHGVPRSREEREKEGRSSKKDFWWLSGSPPTPSDSSTPKDESNGTKTKGRTPASVKQDENKEAKKPASPSSSSVSDHALVQWSINVIIL